MKAKTLSAIFKTVLVLLGLFGAGMCAAWYPLHLRYVLSASGGVAYWVMLALYWVAALPCFAILVVGWMLTGNVKKEDFFTKKNSFLLKLCAFALLAALLFFAVCNGIFWAVRWQSFDMVSVVLFVLGLVFAALAFAASYYVAEAVKYKDDSEGLI